jgi:folylpolyglutamate synthase
MSGRSYKDAIDLLNTLQSNAATLDAIKASGGRTHGLAIPEMIEYLERIGYKVRCILRDSTETLYMLQQEDLNSLNVLHVTGTKGKGSTCAFVDSILRHAKPDWKIGKLHSIGLNSRSLNLRLPPRFVHLATPGCSARANTCQWRPHI